MSPGRFAWCDRAGSGKVAKPRAGKYAGGFVAQREANPCTFTGMKLKSLTFDGHMLRMIFAHETGDVSKMVKCSAIDMVRLPEHRLYQVVRAGLEAECDIACRMFGGEWAKHITKTGTEERASLINSIAKQAKELAPEVFSQ